MEIWLCYYNNSPFPRFIYFVLFIGCLVTNKNRLYTSRYYLMLPIFLREPSIGQTALCFQVTNIRLDPIKGFNRCLALRAHRGPVPYIACCFYNILLKFQG
jgi:hypothetical protein